MRVMRLITVVGFLGAAVTAALLCAGAGPAGSAGLVFVFSAIAFTSGVTAAIGPVRGWGVPGDER